ncbi:TIGR02221 family CRISPR-associated protein [Chitinispirillales bacterium ANBcel5]|uniref:TIGR02221 family CRISPR-associated protein n=1 Tax=Cellulosispirillum alkaliphilum TaxID=3039283 RepID=UPI002A5514BA|nr:TIGR02221 family CRISPR-associated protein [Chitinispirillales bacterium ANBcel5]
MARVFVSFLGTNNYIRCNYHFDKNVNETTYQPKETRFVQEAIIGNVCQRWSAADKIKILLTEEAEEKNWNDEGHKDKNGKTLRVDDVGKPMSGLKTQLEKINLSAKIEPVRGVKDGNSIEDIWEIFSTIENMVDREDTLWLDITNGFRSLPMLLMLLLQYLKVTKNIKIGGIYYGAFEKLGPVYKVKNMALEKRNAPIIDLTAFHVLQTWTEGTDTFKTYGDARRIKEAIEDYCNSLPLPKETGDKQLCVKKMESLAAVINSICLQIHTARGKEIVEGKSIREAKDLITELENEEILPPLKTLLHLIEKKIEEYESDDVKNGFISVKWCIEHSLVQQGITLLQETVITKILSEARMGWNEKTKRELAKRAINNLNNTKNGSNPQKNKKNDVTSKLQEIIISYEELAENYKALTKMRNDINHGGYLDENDNKAGKPDDFLDGLKSSYLSINECFKKVR